MSLKDNLRTIVLLQLKKPYKQNKKSIENKVVFKIKKSTV